MNTPETITNLRTQLSERRIVRQRNKRLEEELASFSAPSERLELDTILSRHDAEEIAELEAMMDRTVYVRPMHL